MPETSMWFSTRWRIKATALASCLLPGLLWAQVALANSGTILPAPPQLPGSRLQGQATLSYLGLRIYHARLWTLPDFSSSRPAEQPLVLELEYLRELNANSIAERSLQEMRRGGSITEMQSERWLAEMQRIFPDVKAGDRITGQHLPGQGARFWHNGRPVGQINDAAFARLFFGIWLAPTTSEPEMRLALLGQKNNSTSQ